MTYRENVYAFEPEEDKEMKTIQNPDSEDIKQSRIIGRGLLAGVVVITAGILAGNMYEDRCNVEIAREKTAQDRLQVERLMWEHIRGEGGRADGGVKP